MYILCFHAIWIQKHANLDFFLCSFHPERLKSDFFSPKNVDLHIHFHEKKHANIGFLCKFRFVVFLCQSWKNAYFDVLHVNLDMHEVTCVEYTNSQFAYCRTTTRAACSAID